MHLFNAQTVAALFGSRLDKAAQADRAAHSETMTEREMFTALAAELAKTARQRRRISMLGRLRSLLSGLLDRAFRTQRENRRQADLIERLEAFPPYLLQDIGVSRETDGRLVVKTEFGQIQELFPASGPKHQAKAHEAKETREARAAFAGE